MKSVLIASLLSSTFAYSQNLDDINQQLQIFLSQQLQSNLALSTQLSQYQEEIAQLKKQNQELQHQIEELQKDKESHGIPCFFNIRVDHLKQHHEIILENVHLIHAPVVQNLHFAANHFVAAGVSGMRYEGPNTII